MLKFEHTVFKNCPFLLFSLVQNWYHKLTNGEGCHEVAALAVDLLVVDGWDRESVFFRDMDSGKVSMHILAALSKLSELNKQTH